jgi:O-antigen/teichoic acid export membrane protein
MSVRRALLFSYVEKYGSYVIALASTMAISRLLTPEDVGAFSVGMALIGLIAVFREFGVTTYVVQEAELSADRLAAAFAVTLGMGMLLGVVIALLAVPVASFYGDPRLREILWILALSFAVTPLGSMSQSLLLRDMHFGALAWIRLVFSLVAALTSVALAWLGLGPQSLAWGALAAAAVNAGISLAVRPHAMGWNFRRADIERVLSTGLPVALVSVVDDVIQTVPGLVVGRWQGLSAAGLLSRAKGLAQMAQQLIARGASPVFLSAYSGLHRDGVPAQALYVMASSCVCGIGWAMLAALAVLADPIVWLLFGSQWTEVAPLLRWLSLSEAVLLLASGAPMLLMASGGAKDALNAKLSALPLYIGATVIGATISLEALAIALVGASAAATWLLARVVKSRAGSGWWAQLAPLGSSALPALCAALAALPVAWWYEHSTVPAWLACLCGCAAAGTGALAGLLVRESPLRNESLRLWRLRQNSS